jgi:hypothetical protein
MQHTRRAYSIFVVDTGDDADATTLEIYAKAMSEDKLEAQKHVPRKTLPPGPEEKVSERCGLGQGSGEDRVGSFLAAMNARRLSG